LAKASFEGLLRDSVTVDLPDGPLVVVARDVLIAMKRRAGRPQDVADIEKLEQLDGP